MNFNFKLPFPYNTYSLDPPTPVYSADYTAPSIDKQVNTIGVNVLNNIEIPNLEIPEQLLTSNLPALEQSLSHLSTSLKLEGRKATAHTLNASLLQGEKDQEREERYDSEENRASKKARTDDLTFQENFLSVLPKKIKKNSKPFFISIVPRLECIVSLKKNKLKIKKLSSKDNTQYKELKTQIEIEEEKLVNEILDNLYMKKGHSYLLAGMNMFQALAIMNLRTEQFLRVWNALLAHNRIDVLINTHPILSLYFKDERERRHYQKHWVSLNHEERQQFVSCLETLNTSWQTNPKMKGLKDKHRTKKLINSHLMNKLKEAKDNEESLLNFFQQSLPPKVKLIQKPIWII